MERITKRFVTETGGVSLTKQCHKKSCDINDIVARAKKIGSLDPMRPKTTPKYMDSTKVPDFQAAMNIVLQANEMLMSLDPKVRSLFGNDPEELVQWLADPVHTPEAIKLGLMVERPKPEVKNDRVASSVVDDIVHKNDNNGTK